MATNWLARRGTKVVGPLPEAKVIELAKCGKLLLTDEVSPDNGNQWVKACEIAAIRDVAARQARRPSATERSRSTMRSHPQNVPSPATPITTADHGLSLGKAGSKRKVSPLLIFIGVEVMILAVSILTSRPAGPAEDPSYASARAASQSMLTAAAMAGAALVMAIIFTLKPESAPKK